MRKQGNKLGAACVALLATLLTTLAFSGSASAFSELYAKFQLCPIKTEGVTRCVHGVTEGGEVKLGNKTVPIVNDVTLQGGYGPPVEGFSTLIAPTNGITLSKTPQPVPGGLLGLVPPEESPPLVAALVELAAENELTGVDSTLELAGPVKLSEVNLREKEGIAIKMPIKVKLENVLLGSNCYIGSDKAPVLWNLTAATTEPPEGFEPLTGDTGLAELFDGGRVLKLTENVLVDNTWTAPKASGCGGPLLAPLIDPVLNLASGLPAAAGVNEAILENTLHVASKNAVIRDQELNP